MTLVLKKENVHRSLPEASVTLQKLRGEEGSAHLSFQKNQNAAHPFEAFDTQFRENQLESEVNCSSSHEKRA